MASAKRPHILVLFLGGSTLDERGRRGASVAKPEDIELWLKSIGEMGMIADVDGVFVHNGLTSIGWTEWVATARIIKDRYARYDGFVVVHQLPTLIPAAIALSLILGLPGKPVVLATSPLTSLAEKSVGLQPVVIPEVSRLGTKANFINAVQVATSEAGEVILVLGHRIFRGRSVHGLLSQLQGEVVGKIDFGVRFFGKQQPRRPRPLKLKDKFESRVAIVEYVPGVEAKQVAVSLTTAHGVFVSVAAGLTVPTAFLVELHRAVTAGTPIILNGQAIGKLPATVLSLAGDRTSLLIRFFWALGQSRQISTLRQLMSS